MANSVHVTSITESEEVRFQWKITGFRDFIRQPHHLRPVEFTEGITLGRKIGFPTTVFMALRKNKLDPYTLDMYAVAPDVPRSGIVAPFTVDMQAKIQNPDGSVYVERKWIGRHHWFRGMSDIEVRRLLPCPSNVPLTPDGDLVMDCIIRMNEKKPENISVDLDEGLEAFNRTSSARVAAQLKALAENGGVSTQITIESRDGLCRTLPDYVLKATSDVFEAMLKDHTAEWARKTIKLRQIGGPACAVLADFIESGKLAHPDWEDPSIIVEVTNAAVMLQIDDLVAYLDTVLGRVCVDANVVKLLKLATLADMKSAKERLLIYIRKQSSADKFLEIITAGFSAYV